MTADLTEEEIARLVHPLVQPGAQIKALRRMGFHVIAKPNGKPLVSRANFEAVTNPTGAPQAATPPAGSREPQMGALIDFFSRKKLPYADGTHAKKQSARSA